MAFVRNLSKFHSLTIERKPCPFDGIQFVVYGHGTYEDSSVLAGQPRKTFIDSFKTRPEAEKAYPRAAEGYSEPEGSGFP